MKRNCGLELRLVPPSLSFPAKDCHHFQQHPKLEMNKMMNGSTTKEEQQQLTIFYNGKVVSCDVTELQAKAIILVASQQKLNTAAMMSSFSVPSPPSPVLQSQQDVAGRKHSQLVAACNSALNKLDSLYDFSPSDADFVVRAREKLTGSRFATLVGYRKKTE
nr:protein TIFY 5A-like [Ipomoea batatas]